MRAAASRIAAVMLAVAPIIGAQQPAQKAFSAGDVLLLSNSTDPAAAAAELKRALVNPDASARAAAARVVAVLQQGSVRADLIGALAREQDTPTAAEMVHDLALLSGAADLSMLEAQVRRLGADGALRLAEWLGRVRSHDFATREADLAASAGSRARELAPIVTMAAVQNAGDADAIYRAWMAIAPERSWGAMLANSVTADGVPANVASLIPDALDSTRATVSEETVWFVLDSVLKTRAIPRDVVIKASASRAGASAWEAFGRELLARGSTSQGAIDRHDVIEREGPAHRADVAALHRASQLTDQERSAVLAVVPVQKGQALDVTGLGDTGHTVSAFTPGIIGATLSAAGCDVRRGDRIGSATIQYAGDGRPQHITVDPTGLTRECQSALTALARTSLLPSDKPSIASQSERLMLPFNAGFAACADAPPAPAAPIPAGTLPHVDGPQKTKDVRPIYPGAAIGARIEGVVILDATISATGCVSRARIVRSIPYLDVPALQAVIGWQFQPARMDGTPVPVFMAVTVNFKLQ